MMELEKVSARPCGRVETVRECSLGRKLGAASGMHDVHSCCLSLDASPTGLLRDDHDSSHGDGIPLLSDGEGSLNDR